MPNEIVLNDRRYRLPTRPTVVICVDGFDPSYLERGIAEFPHYLPDDCAVHFNRLSRPGTAISAEFLLGMIDSVARIAHGLAELQRRRVCRTGACRTWRQAG